jgi:hypothetical protein
MSQDALGAAVHVSGDTVAKIEKAARWPTADIATRCDAVLGTGGTLGRLVPLLERERSGEQSRRSRGHGSERPEESHCRDDFTAIMKSRWPGTRVASNRGRGTDGTHVVWLPGGTHFVDVPLAVSVVPRESLSGDPQTPHISRNLLPQSRAARREVRLTLATRQGDEFLEYYAMDTSAALQASGEEESAITVPMAYLLDDFTYAGLWAATASERSLLEDDAVLAEIGATLRSSVTVHQAIAEDAISTISRMWLGSTACARHILTHLGRTPGSLTFWTREQCGEEAATWLLFSHKLRYLHATTARLDPSTRAVRIFSIPDLVVAQASPADRILVFLAATLMEAHGVTVQLVTDPGYEDVPGFVLGESGPSLIATWVRSPRGWLTDVVYETSVTREHRDVAGYASSETPLRSSLPFRRLEQLAHYLGLDWRWLCTRATAMATAGWGRLLRPRSRLLSVGGLDRACRFLSAHAATEFVPTETIMTRR